MAHAYAPGLKVLHETKILKERRLPLKGDVLVKENDSVEPSQIVARTHLPGNVQMVNVANLLNIDPIDVKEVMKKEDDESVKKGEILAETPGLFGMFKSKVTSPIDCICESCSDVTGQVVLREAPIPVEVDAYVSGRIQKTIPNEGVYVETDAAFIQGIFGIGGESRGEISMVCESREQELTGDLLNSSMKGKIAVGGSFIDLNTYKKAISLGLSGVVVGGFNYQDLEDILGYPLGVAITGSENLITSLIVTEGFGKINMGHRTFDLLKRFDGHFASINGSTQIRAGVIRPEIVIPLDTKDVTGKYKEIDASSGVTEGSLVRVIRAPYFGTIGHVTALPSELQTMESETSVRVAEIDIKGEKVIIPRANLELVETD
jgi:hypothetical protein